MLHPLVSFNSIPVETSKAAIFNSAFEIISTRIINEKLNKHKWLTLVCELILDSDPEVYDTLLLRRWYEIRALYYVKSILTEISASRQDRRVLQKSKIIRIISEHMGHATDV